VPECQKEQAPERGSPAVLLRVEEPVQKIYFSIKIDFYKNIRRGGVSGTPLPLRCLYPPEPGIWTTGVSRPISSGVLHEIFKK